MNHIELSTTDGGTIQITRRHTDSIDVLIFDLPGLETADIDGPDEDRSEAMLAKYGGHVGTYWSALLPDSPIGDLANRLRFKTIEEAVAIVTEIEDAR